MEERRQTRRTFSKIGLAYFIMMVTAVGVQTILGFLLRDQLYLWPKQWQNLLSSIVMYGIAAPVCALLLHRVPVKEQVPDQAAGAPTMAVYLLISFGFMIAGNLIGQALMWITGLVVGHPITNDVAEYLDGSSVWINLLTVSILAPIVEELLFRKLLIDRLRQYGEGLCVLLSGLMFGLFHGNFYQFFYAFGLGCIFAYLYTKTGRIRYTIALHIIINFMSSVVVVGLMNSMDLGMLTEENLQNMPAEEMMKILPQLLALFIYEILLFGSAVVGIVFFFAFRKRISFAAAAQPIEKGERVRIIVCNGGMILFFLGCIGMFALSILSGV